MKLLLMKLICHVKSSKEFILTQEFAPLPNTAAFAQSIIKDAAKKKILLYKHLPNINETT